MKKRPRSDRRPDTSETPPQRRGPPPNLDRPARALAEHLSALSRRAGRTVPPGDAPAGGASGEVAASARDKTARAGATGTTDRQTVGQPERPRRHEFPRRAILLDEQVRAIERRHRRFAESVTPALRALLRTNTGLLLTRVRQLAYADFIAELRGPTGLRLVDYVPGSTPAREHAPLVVEMPLDLLYPVLERLLGGPGDGGPPPPGPPTRTEQAVAGVFFRHLLAWLAESWRDACPDARFECGEAEHNPLLMQVFEPGEPVVLVEFELSLLHVRGPLRICLPTRRFEAVIARFLERESGRSHGRREQERMLHRLAAASVAISAELGPVPLALEDILALQPGDVIDTGIGALDDIAVTIDGQPLLRGRVRPGGAGLSVEIAGDRGAERTLARSGKEPSQQDRADTPPPAAEGEVPHRTGAPS